MLYVITSVFNSRRYNSRYRLYRNFAKYIKDSGAKLITIEAAFNCRPFEVTDPCNPDHIQVKTFTELWHKERMLNLAIERLPLDWQYAAWIDADVIFTRPDWVEETIKMLHHHPIIQMFGKAHDLTPDHKIYKSHVGIINAYQNGLLTNDHGSYSQWHPGFAWAATKETLNNLGGLFDLSILGAGDRHLSTSLIGHVDKSYQKGLHPSYIDELHLYQEDALRHVRKNVGYLKTDLIHYWHGKKADRKYQDRWQILIKHQYNPNLDIKKDVYGLYQWTGNKPQLQYDIMKYMASRNEDSIDME